MKHRLFSLVNSLLSNGYTIRVTWNDMGYHIGMWDFTGSSETAVQSCYNLLMSDSCSRYPELWIFEHEEFFDEENGEACSRLEVDRDSDTVIHHRQFWNDTFIANRVKETQ
jgi:hypothetical protein